MKFMDDLAAFGRWVRGKEYDNGRYRTTDPGDRAGADRGTTYNPRPGASPSTRTGADRYLSEYRGDEFAMGSVHGARAFVIKSNGMLGSISGVGNYTWKLGENLARCHRYHTQRIDRDHDMMHCSCGFYAFYEGSNDYATPAANGVASAVVEGYGRVVIGSRGFRAEKSRILAITFSPTERVERKLMVRSNYPNLPEFPSFADMIAEFPPEANGYTR